MSLLNLYQQLGWPKPEEILSPVGIGVRVVAELASEKIGQVLAREFQGVSVKVGVLSASPDTSEAPIAIICDFANAVSAEVLFEAQRLAWNFSRSLLLITIEPHIIRKWSCCETPILLPELQEERTDLFSYTSNSPQIMPAISIDTSSGSVDRELADSLSWLELLSGRFFERNATRFPQEKRAEQMLLNNLKEVKSELQDLELGDDYIHDILARVIFIQFLFDRKDTAGVSALNPFLLEELARDTVLSKPYSDFASLLAAYDDTYALFRWLDERFNGDLFPGSAEDTSEALEFAWREERSHVKPEHLEKLSGFVSGEIVLKSGQKSLWPLYAFDVIPLEFISSIYEEFVSRETGVAIHYTPVHLVDLMLDKVLPWDGNVWDVRILDPSCGSGIFLVKAYQRLIYRWRAINQRREVPINVLRRLLEHNIFGVDSDPQAIRVASFSMYLAMCDEIDPRNYWRDPNRVLFPKLRNERIIVADFFDDSKKGIRAVDDKGVYDLVIGNPPWGDRTISSLAREWAKRNDWKVANKDFGVLFVVKSMALVKQNGLVCLVQSAGALLYNKAPTAVKLREKVFLQFRKVECVVNLAAFRLSAFQVFNNVKVPSCIVVIRNISPDGGQFTYECPKPLRTAEDIYRLVVSYEDTHFIYPDDIIREPWIWSVLMWGGDRDRDLIRRMQRNPSLGQLKAQGIIDTREGVNFGDRKKRQEKINGRRRIDINLFAAANGLYVDARNLPVITEPYIDTRASTSLSAFQSPQMIIKASWVQQSSRFEAKIVIDDPENPGVICNQSFVSVHLLEPDDNLMQLSCLCYNSLWATYFLFVTSGRFAFDRSEPLATELLSLPLPSSRQKLTSLDPSLSKSDIDNAVYNLLRIKEADSIIIEDLIQYILADFKGRGDPPGYQTTRRSARMGGIKEREPDLKLYSDTFLKVLRSAYGNDKLIGAIVFSEDGSEKLPMRVIRVALNDQQVDGVRETVIIGSELRQRIFQSYEVSLKQTTHRRVVYQRTLRSYSSKRSGGSVVLYIDIIKRDQMRYWNRAAALRDADEVVADISSWAMNSVPDNNSFDNIEIEA